MIDELSVFKVLGYFNGFIIQKIQRIFKIAEFSVLSFYGKKLVYLRWNSLLSRRRLQHSYFLRGMNTIYL